MTKKVLILGASGMLGNTIFSYLSIYGKLKTIGILRNEKLKKKFPKKLQKDLHVFKIYTKSDNELINIINKFRPDYVVNCVGIIKQHINSHLNLKDKLEVNSIFPHKLKTLSKLFKFKLIHFSTDCVFSGNKGMYNEKDIPDPLDNYGISKLLGEVMGDNIVTFRTSIIGHELSNKKSLLEWFLKQKNEVDGFANAYFSGFTTLDLAKFILKFIKTKNKLNGIYHLSNLKISKYHLLNKINKIYNKNICIKKLNYPKIDRSLDSKKLEKKFFVKKYSWNKSIYDLKEFYEKEIRYV